MLGRFRIVLRRRPVLAAASVLVAMGLLAFCAVQAVGWARWQVFALRIDAASRVQDALPTQTKFASWSFAFRNRAVTLRVPVDLAELARARQVDTGQVFLARGSLRSRYVACIVRAQSKSGFIDGLAQELRRVRSERGLDDDEYLELMVRAMQSLPYGIQGWRVRLPVDVVSSGFGDCADKALALGALMVHEGYKTGVWVLDSQNHAALGVASDAATFRDSGYAYIETTCVSYIGQVADKYRAAGPVARPPQFIAIGGTRRYRAGYQVEYILRELAAAQESSALLEPYVRLLGTSPESWRVRYRDLALRREAAIRLATYIRGQSDEREAVFERLVASTANVEAGGPVLVR